jgi:DNA repair exonuclease SbcCD ATPase subunit
MEFMDSLRRGVDRAGFEVDRLLRANRTRSRIGALRSEIDGELREIGRYVMELYGHGEDIPAGLRERYEKVRQLQTELAGREAELEAINNEMPHELEEAPLQQPAPSGATCPRCGRPVPESASFCPSCGASLTAPAEKPSSPPEPPAEQMEPPPPAG